MMDGTLMKIVTFRTIPELIWFVWLSKRSISGHQGISGKQIRLSAVRQKLSVDLVELVVQKKHIRTSGYQWEVYQVISSQVRASG